MGGSCQASKSHYQNGDRQLSEHRIWATSTFLRVSCNFKQSVVFWGVFFNHQSWAVVSWGQPIMCPYLPRSELCRPRCSTIEEKVELWRNNTERILMLSGWFWRRFLRTAQRPMDHRTNKSSVATEGTNNQDQAKQFWKKLWKTQLPRDVHSTGKGSSKKRKRPTSSKVNRFDHCSRNTAGRFKGSGCWQIILNRVYL